MKPLTKAAAAAPRGGSIEAKARGHWRYDIRPDGRSLITSCTSHHVEEASI